MHGGNIAARWEVARALDEGDKATGISVLLPSATFRSAKRNTLDRPGRTPSSKTRMEQLTSPKILLDHSVFAGIRIEGALFTVG
jgi:hypothetical protein